MLAEQRDEDDRAEQGEDAALDARAVPPRSGTIWMLARTIDAIRMPFPAVR
ncbi:hypothetical protein [Streptomyces violascens]|uniref:hypothetical protein n=1 Tax=Streptomyces violascens TaxID=67381 RepID=UPI0016771FFE|nr:hypothetical protein [Streptomyces violascens]